MTFSSRILCFVCLLGASAASCFSLDRDAFTFTHYDLHVRIEPEQERLGVRGTVTLRNDSATPQKIAVLQISSSLAWRSITIAGKAPQFVLQPYTSDIDHTGALSEAIVTLPQEVVPHGTVDLDIGYEGVILPDATRLTRIGTPEDAAKNSDWDQISANFTAVRGAGYVAWYPIATEAANLSDGDSLSEELGRWRQREVGSEMGLLFESTQNGMILFTGTPAGSVVTPEAGTTKVAAFGMTFEGADVPTFVQAEYSTIKGSGDSTVNYLPGKASSAQSYADTLRTLIPFLANRGPKSLQVTQLPDADAPPFETGNLLLIPFDPAVSESDRLTLIYAATRDELPFARRWMSEGVGHLAQVIDIEQRHGRSAAMEYLEAHRGMLAEWEKRASPEDVSAAGALSSPSARSLINTSDELFRQSKAMYVWCMLRDMIGDADLKQAISIYHPQQDKEPSYMPKLIQAQTQRDLSWFFDDWVYRDRGLPDFKVDSAFTAKTLNGTFMVTVTVDNLGTAGAEVPVIVKFGGGEMSRRLEVRGKSRATFRVETPAAPEDIVVNDGSVPESDVSNNNFTFETAKK
jgi:hypothetical protein